jgi:5-dehydro-4-deoxyglucarate dehydratase
MMTWKWAAVVAAGGTGELYSLLPDEHRQVVAAVVAEVKGRAPVIAGAGFNASLGAELARQGAAAGADGILCFPPYYPGAADDGLVAYYKAIADATPLGVFIYSRDWVAPGGELVARMADAIPNLVAWKDGQGDVRRLQSIRDRVGDRLHFIGGIGDDCVPGYYAIGIRTYTSSISNWSPGLSLELHERAAAGDFAMLSRLMSDYVVPLYDLRARRRGYEVSVMKAGMDIIGLRGGPVRSPLVDVLPEEMPEIRAMLARWKAVL